MSNPQFLIARYANGSAGKFLINLLMSSPSVAHFDSMIEQNKTEANCLRYTQEHFVNRLSEWLINEPKHSEAWNLHHVSSNYARGDDLTTDDFLHQAKQNATEYFWNSVDSNKHIPFVWHKVVVPEFFQSAKFVTIIIDPGAVKWYHRARWYKQYGIINNMIHIREEDPTYNNAKLKMYYDQFNNSYQVDQPPYSFIKQNILNNPKKRLFQNDNAFIDQSVAQEFINLSDILNVDRLIDRVNQICDRFELLPVSESHMINSHRHWIDCHNFKYSKK
jgi:hypothetical protein